MQIFKGNVPFVMLINQMNCGTKGTHQHLLHVAIALGCLVVETLPTELEGIEKGEQSLSGPAHSCLNHVEGMLCDSVASSHFLLIAPENPNQITTLFNYLFNTVD